MGTHPPRGPVGATVARLARKIRGLRWGQTVFVAVAATIAVQCAALASGAAPFGIEGWSLGLVCGLSVGRAWWAAHPVSEAALAARIDAEVGARGEFETAWEAERRGARMAPALSRRALDDLRGEELLRAAVPDSTVAVAAPLIAVCVLAWMLEAARDGEPGPDVSRLAAGLAEQLEAAGFESGESSETPHDRDAAPQVLRRLARAAERLARASDDEAELDAEQRRETEELLSELERLAREEPADSPWRATLDAARNTADALRDAALGGEPTEGGPAADDQGPGAQIGGEGDGAGRARATESAPAPGGAGPPAGSAAGAWLDLAPADRRLLDAWRRTGRSKR